ncbi:EF-hand and coiled-coil domain-containing protein 1 [Oncorhynchus keta]|uniref:EF-hand and coiled-coil domain-containing protein 1 n=1 Tax=Oncorhynchus keta TaxID=8018 RepID=UPI00227B6285|nr:EF-hand and coiled-coil domain-containing protein 1 [Oncorhynchus keta]
MDKILVKDSCDLYGRPARRTQWIASTLAYHYGLDRGVENEIIVLATGLDQYLQEIFHHMDCTGDGKISMEDFNILCEILGLNKDSESEECVGVLDNLPSEFTFRQFHAKLCGYFSTKAGSQYENGRLLVGKDSEHIETQIRLRIPLRRRKKMLSLGTGGRESPGSSPNSDRHLPGCRQLRASCTRECYEEIVALEEAEERITKLQDENASLRELVEDMRAALQSSDARSLALQVGLLKSHSKHESEGGCFIAHHKLSVRTTHSSNNCHGNTKIHNLSHIKTTHSSNPSSQRDPSQYSSLKTSSQYTCLRSLVHEIDPIHSSRNGQVEEAILFNKKLEQELRSSREAVSELEGCNRALQVEQGDMRRKVEDARQALVSGMGKVKELEAKASRVPVLQRHIKQLEQEIRYYRSEVSKLQLSGCTRANKQVGGACGPVQRCCLDDQQDRWSPTGRSETTPDNSQEQLFRSVEGQAASDDDEEKWTGEQQRQVDEMKRILARLSCCGDRCDDKAMKKLLSHFSGSRRRGGKDWELNSLLEVDMKDWELNNLLEVDMKDWELNSLLEVDMKDWELNSLLEVDMKDWDLNNLLEVDMKDRELNSLLEVDMKDWELNSLLEVDMKDWELNNLLEVDMKDWELNSLLEVDMKDWELNSLLEVDMKDWELNNLLEVDMKDWELNSLLEVDMKDWELNNLLEVDMKDWELNSLLEVDMKDWELNNLLEVNMKDW